MKRLVNMKIIALVFVIALVSILTLNTKKAKAAGTVTWSGPSSITIRETMHNIVNPIIATRTYSLYDSGMVAAASAATNADAIAKNNLFLSTSATPSTPLYKNNILEI